MKSWWFESWVRIILCHFLLGDSIKMGLTLSARSEICFKPLLSLASKNKNRNYRRLYTNYTLKVFLMIGNDASNLKNNVDLNYMPCPIAKYFALKLIKLVFYCTAREKLVSHPILNISDVSLRSQSEKPCFKTSLFPLYNIKPFNLKDVLSTSII